MSIPVTFLARDPDRPASGAPVLQRLPRYFPLRNSILLLLNLLSGNDTDGGGSSSRDVVCIVFPIVHGKSANEIKISISDMSETPV